MCCVSLAKPFPSKGFQPWIHVRNSLRILRYLMPIPRLQNRAIPWKSLFVKDLRCTRDGKPFTWEMNWSDSLLYHLSSPRAVIFKWGQLCPSGDSRQSLETFLVVTVWGMVGIWKGEANTVVEHPTRHSPMQEELTWTRTSIGWKITKAEKSWDRVTSFSWPGRPKTKTTYL